MNRERTLRLLEPVYITHDEALPHMPHILLPRDLTVKVCDETVEGAPLVDFDPPEVSDWLVTRGWRQESYASNSTRVKYSHEALQLWSFTWEQAVAHETFRFLNMGSR